MNIDMLILLLSSTNIVHCIPDGFTHYSSQMQRPCRDWNVGLADRHTFLW